MTASDSTVPDVPKGLVYASDSMPGYSRRRRGKGWSYYKACGALIRDRVERERLNALAIPPAYRDVWYAPRPEFHLQSTGVDEAGRKQYRYHAEWDAYRAQQKFDHLKDFGRALPRLRRSVRRILKTKKDQEKPQKVYTVAAILRLLDKAPLRIGSRNEDSEAVGATTLEDGHVSLDEKTISLSYTAKGGKRVERQLSDQLLQETLETIDDLPGKTLFQYLGSDGELHGVDSADVNDHLKSFMRCNSVSAKTFRTWQGTLAASEVAFSVPELSIKAMSEAAADVLRNTPAIARSSYIHPAVIALNGERWSKRQRLADSLERQIAELRVSEVRLLQFLERYC